MPKKITKLLHKKAIQKATEHSNKEQARLVETVDLVEEVVEVYRKYYRLIDMSPTDIEYAGERIKQRLYKLLDN